MGLYTWEVAVLSPPQILRECEGGNPTHTLAFHPGPFVWTLVETTLLIWPLSTEVTAEHTPLCGCEWREKGREESPGARDTLWFRG